MDKQIVVYKSENGQALSVRTDGETVSWFDCVFSCVVHVAFLSFDADIIAYFAHCMVKISLRMVVSR